MITRYDVGEYGDGMYPHGDGDWIKYEDLKAEQSPQAGLVSPSKSSDLLSAELGMYKKAFDWLAIRLDGQSIEWLRNELGASHKGKDMCAIINKVMST